MIDTICALATSAGGAIAVVRLSGKQSIPIVNSIFQSRGKKNQNEKNDTSLISAKGQSLRYGEIVIDDNVIDDVLVSVFRAPHSYTGEDAAEISCHGGRYIITTILNALIQRGARQATPGEFTLRAYLNGRMDLSQAEAVADLIAAANRATHTLAISQLKGHFSSELAQLRGQLLELTSLVELELDFSEEDVTFADRTQLMTLVENIHRRVTALTDSFRVGNAIKQGVPVAIIGKTNVGKSTLLNRLLGDDKAIVSDIHGTTRDTIEDTIDIQDITFRFIDTAGLRATDDEVERLGQQRTQRAINQAAIIVWLIDADPDDKDIEEMRARANGKTLLTVRNKCDLTQQRAISHTTLPTINISAKYGEGVDALKQALVDAADIPPIHEGDVIITSLRHYECLLKAAKGIQRVEEGLTNMATTDILSEDLREVLRALAEITGGAITSQETLNNIFSHFCIGK